MEKSYCKAWNTMMSVLYSPEDLSKLEWAIGASLIKSERDIHKICIISGEHATGKTTALFVIQRIVPGYSIFVPRAYEEFHFERDIWISHDGPVSFLKRKKITDSLLSSGKKCILFCATNDELRPEDLADPEVAKHVIDIHTSGERFEIGLYERLREQIFSSELMDIGDKCAMHYVDHPNLYANYIPELSADEKGENK